jgi:hypothetical protein
MFSAADIQNQPNTLKKDLHHMRSKLMANLVTIYVIETKTEFIYADSLNQLYFIQGLLVQPSHRTLQLKIVYFGVKKKKLL